MEEQELRQLFRNNSDCYTQVWITGKGYADEPGLSEDKFIELVNKILSNERETVRKHEQKIEPCCSKGFQDYNDCDEFRYSCHACKYYK